MNQIKIQVLKETEMYEIEKAILCGLENRNLYSCDYTGYRLL